MLAYVDAGPITHAVVGSVVPALTRRISDALAVVTGCLPLIVRAEAVPGIRLRVDEPAQVGVDRVANAIAAREAVGGPVIVADLGSVTTFDVVDAQGDLRGVVIAPGIRALGQALTASGAQLPKIDIDRPEGLVGRNTVDAMRAGVYWGYVERRARRPREAHGRARRTMAGSSPPAVWRPGWPRTSVDSSAWTPTSRSRAWPAFAR